MVAGTGQIRAGAAYVELFLKDNRLNKGLAAAQKRLTAWGASVSSLGRRVFTVGGLIAGGLSLALKRFSDVGSRLNDMSARTGVAASALAELSFVAEQTGTDLDAVEKGIKKMAATLYDAERGSTEAVDALKAVGLTARDLKGLGPEDQFQRIADALAGVSDESKRAALAQKLFGRAGTQLLPMLPDLAALRKEARDLGLVPSDESIKAADDVGDAFDKIKRQIGAVVYEVGAALAPAFLTAAKRISAALKSVIDWVRANKELVVWAAKVTAIVLGVGAALIAVGAALIAVGAALSGLGSIIGLGMAAISGLGSVIGVAGSALGMLLSPIGLVIAAVVSLAGYFLYTSGEIGRAVDWLSGVWDTLKSDALGAFQGIKDALAAGDFALAAQILWASLRLVFQRGISALMIAWAEWKAFFKRIWTEAVFSVAAIFVNAWAGIQQTWVSAIGFFSDSWTKFTGFLSRTWNTTVGFIKKAWQKLKGFVTGVDTSVEIERINRETDEANEESRRAQDQSLSEAEAARRKRSDQIEADRKGTLDELGKDKDREHERISRQQNEAIAKLEKELADLQAQRDELLKKAKGGADRARLEALDQREADIRNRLAGAGEDVDTRSDQIRGTFSAAVASRFGNAGADRVRKQIADNTKENVKQTKGIKDKIDGIVLRADNS